MLCQLTIRNVAIVEHLDLELPGGMLAVSGETGAGKSIMLDALALALGDRGDAGCVRHGSDKADISACFDIQSIPQAQEWLAEREMLQDHQCILRRTISAEGRSRAWINGQPCNLQELRQLGEHLLEIHGQHAHQKLLNPHTHQYFLDDYAQLTETTTAVGLSFKSWQKRLQHWQAVQERSEEDQAKVQLLSYQVEELQQLNVRQGELEELEQEQKILANAEHNLRLGQQLVELTRDGDENLQDQLRRCRSLLNQMQLPRATLDEVDTLLDSAAIQLDEALNSLQHGLDQCEISPERLQDVDERLHLIYSLARKHRIDPYGIPAFQQQLEAELADLNIDDDQLAALEADVATHFEHYLMLAEKLSAQRQQAAEQLSNQVVEQLRALSMPHSRFIAQISRLETAQYNAKGIDQVEFLLSANPGQPPRALHKVASGGELSRISLAIQVVAAHASTMPTLIFDEVDVGIGGAVAEVVGKLLRQLGDRVQVMCVTHQPQVAAQAHHHLFVSKEVRQGLTHSRIHRLSDNQRVDEIARMLGGSELSHHARAHAEAMLNQLPH